MVQARQLTPPFEGECPLPLPRTPCSRLHEHCSILDQGYFLESKDILGHMAIAPYALMFPTLAYDAHSAGGAQARMWSGQEPACRGVSIAR